MDPEGWRAVIASLDAWEQVLLARLQEIEAELAELDA